MARKKTKGKRGLLFFDRYALSAFNGMVNGVKKALRSRKFRRGY